jgi:surfeit locus 1 family protein
LAVSTQTARIRLGRLELRLRPLWLLLVAVAIALCIGWARWNLQRAETKRALRDSFAAASTHIEPLGARSLATLPRYVQIEVHGHYRPEHQFLLDNMTHNGEAGYEVLTPFQIEDGRWLLVNRGWLPLVDHARARRPDVGMQGAAAVQGNGADSTDGILLTTVRGRIDDWPVAGIAAGHMSPLQESSWPRLTSYPQTAELASALGHSIESRQVLLAADENFGFAREWRPASAAIPPERNVAYAVQWWCFAALAMIFYLYFNLKRRVTK